MLLYTVSEAAKILKVQSKTVRNYLNSGRLAGSKLGNRWRIKPEDLDKPLVPANQKTGRVY